MDIFDVRPMERFAMNFNLFFQRRT
jgi:hypothetical protein